MDDPHARPPADLPAPIVALDPDPVVPLWGGAPLNGRFAVRGRSDATQDGVPVSSQECLGCHDSVLARNALTPDVSGRLVPMMDGRLRANHPIGVRYDAGPGTHLRSPATPIPGTSMQVGDLLVDDRLECTSCHTMFRDAAVPGSRLIRRAFRHARDACMVCHDM